MRLDAPDLGRRTDSARNEETAREGRARTPGGPYRRVPGGNPPGSDAIARAEKLKGGGSVARGKKRGKNPPRGRGAKDAARDAMRCGVIRGPYRGTAEEFEKDLDAVCGLANMHRMWDDGTLAEWTRWLEEPPPARRAAAR